jgi:hypothetical protein
LSTKKKKECPLSFINGHSLGFILEIAKRREPSTSVLDDV